MLVLELSKSEHAAGRLSAASVERACTAVREDGFVVMKDVVDKEHIAILREKLFEDLEALRQRRHAPYNFNRSNIQQDPPPFPPYLFRDVLVNDFVIDVTQAVLGPGVKNSYYSGNTSLPSELRQPVHADTGHLWTGLAAAHPAHGLVVNVPLVDMDATNGSTELWPGTHLEMVGSVDEDIKIPAGVLEKRRAIAPPIQPSVDSGSVLIRDLRMWHAGMPNHTSTPRPMIAMIHYVRWYGGDESVPFAREAEPILAHPRLRTNATYIDGPIDYIHQPQAYDFHSEAREE